MSSLHKDWKDSHGGAKKCVQHVLLPHEIVAGFWEHGERRRMTGSGKLSDFWQPEMSTAWFQAHPVLSDSRLGIACHTHVFSYKDPTTDLDYCIPIRLYGDGAETQRVSSIRISHASGPFRQAKDGNDYDSISMLPFEQHPGQSDPAPRLDQGNSRLDVAHSDRPQVRDHQRELLKARCKGEGDGDYELELQRPKSFGCSPPPLTLTQVRVGGRRMTHGAMSSEGFGSRWPGHLCQSKASSRGSNAIRITSGFFSTCRLGQVAKESATTAQRSNGLMGGYL